MIPLASDLTRDTVRTRAMTAIGMTIGATFAVSLVLGPALTAVIGVPGVFALTGVLALGAIALLQRGVPDPWPRRHATHAGAMEARAQPTASCCVSTTESSRCTRR